MGAKTLGGVAAALVAVALAAPALAADGKDDPLAKYRAGDAYSGYIPATEQTREMQDDDFMNPGMLWVEKAEDLWTQVDGEAGKSCADCHGDVSSLKGVATRYPTTDPETGKFMNMELRINDCRERRMQAKPWKWESDELLGMTALVKMQSRGMPVNVDITGPNKAWFEKGKKFYETPRGQLNMACVNCHVDNAGNRIRAETLSQGQTNGFPTYRLKWQKLGSLHRRFRGCNNNIRASKLPNGSEEYLALELYTAWRGNGLPIETPSVRK